MIRLVKKFEAASIYRLIIYEDYIIVKVINRTGSDQMYIYVLDSTINIINQLVFDENTTDILLFGEHLYSINEKQFKFIDIDFALQIKSKIFMLNNRVILRADENFWNKEINTPESPVSMEIYIDYSKVYETNIYGNPWSIGNNYYFRKTGKEYSNFVKKIDIGTGQILWEFHLSEQKVLFKTENLPDFEYSFNVRQPKNQLYKNQLWFTEKNGSLICINNNTGELLHFIRDAPQYTNILSVLMPTPILPFAEKLHMDSIKGKLYMLHKWYYWVLDLETLDHNCYFIKEYVEQLQCLPDFYSVLHNENIVFVSKSNKKFASFNVNTKKIDWMVPFEEDVQLVIKIEVFHNHLFVVYKDINNTSRLHLYEFKQ